MRTATAAPEAPSSRTRRRRSALAMLASAAVAACGGADAPGDAARAAAGALDAAPPAPPGRPAGVPADFVRTPSGWFHPSCVLEVGRGERIRAHLVVRDDGSARAIPPCAHPSYDARGALRTPASAPPPYVGWSWIEAAETRSGPVELLSARWTVPSNPAAFGPQTVYLFPGLSPLATNDTILQPVLGWNTIGDDAWTIASWNCCKNGNNLHSLLFHVPAGAEIVGRVAGASCDPATGVCASWRIETSAVGGPSTVLDTDSYGEALDAAHGGALEVYSLDTCSQLPSSGSVTFRDVRLTRVGGTPIAPSWLLDYWPVTPSCSYGVVPDPVASAVSLRWCRPATCSGLCGQIVDDCGGVLSCPACAATSGCKGSSRCCVPGATRCALCVSSKQACP